MAKNPFDSERNNKPFPASRAGDFMLNSLLRDLLKGNNPPDLEQRILLKLRARQMGLVEPPPMSRRRPIFSDHSLDEALGAAQADVEFVSDGQFKSVVRTKQRVDPRRDSDVLHVHPRLWDYRWVRRSAALVALAASCAGVWVGYQAVSNSFSLETGIAMNGPSELPSMAKEEGPYTSDIAAELQPKKVDDTIVKSEPKATEVLPSTRSPENADKTKWVVSLPQPSAIPKPALTKIVDAQLEQAWKRFGVDVRKEPIGDAWLQRVSLAAVGRLPTAAEKESFRTDKGSDRAERLVTRLLESEEFAIHWSRLLAEHYLGNELHSLKSQPTSVQQFVAWIESGLIKDRKIQDIELAMASNRSEAADSDAEFWWKDTANRESAIAGDLDNNTKFKRRYGSMDAPFVGVASNLLHRSGNSLVSCTQCHKADDNALAGWGNTPSGPLSSFWNFPGELAKEAAKRRIPAARIAEKDNYAFFYEDDTGKMVMADGGLPADSDDPSSRIKVTDWLEQSQDARAGVVELIWSKVFHQPLVPAFGLTESEAAEERSDLKTLLCGQLQASGNVREVVASLLLTDAMRTPEAKPTANWYYKANDELLSEYHRRARLFAFVPTVALNSSQTSRYSTNEIAKWIGPTSGRADNSLLAQADSSKGNGIGASKTMSMQMSDEQLLFMLSVAKPYAKMEEFVERISKQGLEWDDQINHLYLMTDGRYPTRNERADANRLLELTGGDPKQALRLLATTRHGSY